MIQQRLAAAINQHNWFTVTIEILIVVTGIFIGLQVDDWNEARKDRQVERRYLERIHADLAIDIGSMQDGISLANQRREMGRLLLQALEHPDLVRADPTAFMYAIEQANYTYSPSSENDTFEELKYSGELRIIRNPTLRAALTGYYKKFEDHQQWNYIRESEQVGYNEAKLGILTAKQIYALNNYELLATFTESEALEALDRIRNKPAFIERIPYATHHLWDRRAYQVWEKAAQALQLQISAELGNGRP